MKHLKKFLAGLFAAIILLGNAAVAVPAQASISYSYKVCNSGSSDTIIAAYQLSDEVRHLLPANGSCVYLWNENNNIRVDVDHYNQGVHSYKIAHIGHGWNVPCYNSANEESNPPDSYIDTGAIYRVWYHKNCQ